MMEMVTVAVLIIVVAIVAMFLALIAVNVALFLALRARIPQGSFAPSEHGSTHA
jgi:hypothetical protein